MRLILPVYTTASNYKHFIYFPSVFIFPFFSTEMHKQLAFVTIVATTIFQTILLEFWLQCSSFVCYFLFYDSFISQYILRLVRLFSYKVIKVIQVDWPKYIILQNAPTQLSQDHVIQLFYMRKWRFCSISSWNCSNFIKVQVQLSKYWFHKSI